MKAQVQRLESMSKDVRSRIQDDRPAAVEVDQLLAQTTKVRETLTTLSLFSAGGAWRGIETGTDALARAYHAPKP